MLKLSKTRRIICHFRARGVVSEPTPKVRGDAGVRSSAQGIQVGLNGARKGATLWRHETPLRSLMGLQVVGNDFSHTYMY